MHKQVCHGSPGLCADMARMNSSLLMHFLKSSRFTGITGKEYNNCTRWRIQRIYFIRWRSLFRWEWWWSWKVKWMSLSLLSTLFVFRYDILNLQGNANELEPHLHYVEVGTWSTGKLNLNTSAIRLFSDQRPLENVDVRRFCSESCPTGYIKVNSTLS